MEHLQTNKKIPTKTDPRNAGQKHVASGDCAHLSAVSAACEVTVVVFELICQKKKKNNDQMLRPNLAIRLYGCALNCDPAVLQGSSLLCLHFPVAATSCLFPL